MSMKKYGDAQKAEVFVGKEASIVKDHLIKNGKALSDFTKKELEAFHAELDSVRPEVDKAEDEVETTASTQES